MPDVYDDIQHEELSSDLQLVSETLGLPVARGLVREFGGCQLSIPKGAARQAIIRHILKRYNGHNATFLSKELGVSTRRIFQILKEHNKTNPADLPLLAFCRQTSIPTNQEDNDS